MMSYDVVSEADSETAWSEQIWDCVGQHQM